MWPHDTLLKLRMLSQLFLVFGDAVVLHLSETLLLLQRLFAAVQVLSPHLHETLKLILLLP